MPRVYEIYAEDAGIASSLEQWGYHGLDYLAETDKTASGVFRCDHVGREELLYHLRLVAEVAQGVDVMKKLLFRKRTREEVNLPPMVEGDRPLQVAPEFADLFHGIIGNITEVGEQAEILITYLETGVVDKTNVREEIGDNLWYLARLIKWVGTTFLTEMKRNVAKLRARHGESFNKERDGNRDIAAERKVLEE